MTAARRHRTRLFLPLLVGAALLVGCDNTLAPIDPTPEARFSLYGFLSSSADTQFVRVAPLRPTIVAEADTPPVPLIVTSTDATTGAQTVWTDSLVTLDDGTTGHLFFARFRPEPGHTYHLDVTDGQGPATRATTVLPPPPSIRVNPLLGDSLNLSQQVTLLGIRQQPEDLQMAYAVTASDLPADTFAFSYRNQGNLVSEGWTLVVRLKQDQQTILRLLNRSIQDPLLSLLGLNLTIDIPGTDWTMAPGHNIERGTGFFASLTQANVTWTLSAADLEALGFD